MQATATHRSHLKTQWVKDFYGDSTLTEKSTKFKNLYEYGDNAMRYFRFTRHLQVISDPLQGDWRISVEPLRHTENELLLSIFETYAQSFTSVEEYLEYLGDPEQPSLPWRQLDYLKRIATSLRTEILNVSASETTVSTDLLEVDLNSLSQEGLEFLIDQLRTEIRRLTLQAERDRLRLSVDKLDEHAQAISKFKRQKGVQPEDFEHLLYQILVTIDDELQIQPNYPTDDYGNPISHAPGGKADIECFYSNFAMIVEVTLDTGNFQWVREGQPVMRHLREFEERVGTENIYCLFVAPKIHDDTYSQFWFAVKYEYKGARQRILPLNSDQFRIVIEAMRSWIEKHQKADHRLLQQLLDDALEIDQVNGYDKWREHIQRTLDQWTAEVKNG
ncbi:MAG: hypothetical protein KatS3mg016_0461 [Fimbriimonadales bacterium]|nr:MAG: hypothetical protein KatS3mg016_0461 [Fimbriimonadales bacterium]